MPRHDADLYDYLATSKVSEVTVAQLEQALENSFINKSNIEFWKGPITVNRLLEVSRTYPGAGMPIPEESVIASNPVGAGESVVLQPSGTQIFHVTGIEVTAAAGTPEVSVLNFNGSASCMLHSGTSSTNAASFFPWESVFPITPTNYLRVDNSDLSNAITVVFAYHVVSL